MAKKALCIGIDRYPRAPLSGCVNDSRAWQRALSSRGFEIVPPLENQNATLRNMLKELDALVSGSRSGDVLVIQFAGHGTQVSNANPSEADEGTLDEALVPVDFPTAGHLVDDDLARIFSKIPTGVSVYVFFDCCHSGTATRTFGGLFGTTGDVEVDVRARSIVLTPSEQLTHRVQYAARRAVAEERGFGADALTRFIADDRMTEILFAACLPHETSLESGGSGLFTSEAMKVLNGDISRMTNDEFMQRVSPAVTRRQQQLRRSSPQHPELYGRSGANSAPFLGGLPGTPTPPDDQIIPPPANLEQLLAALRTLADQADVIRARGLPPEYHN